MSNTLLKLCLTLCLSVLLLSCSKVSQENFDQIKSDMTMQQVIAILGEPTSSQSLTIAGISGTSAVWKDKNAEIDIQFLNDKVTVKTFNKADKSSAKNVSDDANAD